MMNPKPTNEVYQTRISMVQEYISRHFREELPLSELAAVANLSPTSFCHFFKQNTGDCISNYILRVRIRHATDLLLTTEKSVKSIAYESGFNTLSYFNRQYKRLTGFTPTEMREKHRE